MATKTWAERFPHPGEAPERPADDHPEEADALHRWWQSCYVWNEYVQAVRRYEVARMIDALDRLGEATVEKLTPADIIAMNIGASFLDGTIGDSFFTGPRGGTPSGMRPL